MIAGKKLHICLILLIALSLIPFRVFGQRYTVSGYVVDDQTRETLIGATIYHPESGRGTVTDSYGYFRFSGLSPGNHTLILSYMGYDQDSLMVKLVDKSLVISEVYLRQSFHSVDEVSIIAVRPDRAADRQVETSMLELSPKTIQSIPTAGKDVFSAIKFLPGIERTEPFSPLYSVRGGDPGENAVMLDGVMIYNPYHSSINSGIFNTQTIKNVDLLTGGFGAEYGGRNSSVMYITTKDGNSTEMHGEVEPSTFHSKVFLEFPAGKNASAIVAGRYYYDIFSEFIYQSQSYFYDFNLSYTARLSNKHRLSLKYFQSRDRNNIDFSSFYQVFGNTFGIDLYDDFNFRFEDRWKNLAGTIIHKWAMTPRIYMRTQLYYSAHQSENASGVNFQFDFADEATDTLNFNWNTNSIFTNRISDLCAKSFLNILLFRNNNLRIGGELNAYHFQNTAAINDFDQGSLENNSMLYTLFMEDKLELGPLIIRPGVRFTRYNGKDIHYEPRVNAVLNFPHGYSLKLAWGEYYQYVISMNTNEVEMNQAVDYYFPLTTYEPSKSVHYIAGIEKAIGSHSLLSLNAYYKNIERVYTFDINQTANEVLMLSDKLQQGSGDAYGGEIMYRGRIRNWSGWMSYGLAWANRQYPMTGMQKYPYDYNRRHTFKLVGNYTISESLEYNTSFLFMSGTYRSIEQILQNYYYYNPDAEELSFFPIWIPEGKNTAKMPPVMNLDMSIRKKLRQGFGKQIADKFHADESYLTVTIRNLLFFRRNVDYYYPISGIPRWEGKYLPVGTNLFPSIGFSYTIKF
ncbi:MAG: TonB-dependent receptor [Bacteroidales bacterium]|nr:TonB-dependent receptor [Bacteroidales bacterium]